MYYCWIDLNALLGQYMWIDHRMYPAVPLGYLVTTQHYISEIVACAMANMLGDGLLVSHLPLNRCSNGSRRNLFNTTADRCTDAT
jgi:hypothetical protein